MCRDQYTEYANWSNDVNKFNVKMISMIGRFMVFRKRKV